MNKILARCIFVVMTATVVILSIAAPWVLGDGNSFLAGFVNHELLNFLGIIVTITLASTANLHLEFNRVEDCIGKPLLAKTRAAVRRSAFLLIAVLALAVVLVVVKPLAGKGDIPSSFFNGFAVILVGVSVMTLADMITLVFKVPPIREIEPREEESSDEGHA